MARITKEMLPALQGVIPCPLATCSAAGTPNITYVSQVYYVDEQHVAISWQFFHKTMNNLEENPFLTTIITDPQIKSLWKLGLKFLEVKKDGEIFEEMDMQLQALVSAMPMETEFKIHAALICEVQFIEQVYPY